VVLINIAFFWGSTPFSQNVKRRFGGTNHLHIQSSDSAVLFVARLIPYP
jgi:hypothetical protein